MAAAILAASALLSGCSGGSDSAGGESSQAQTAESQAGESQAAAETTVGAAGVDPAVHDESRRIADGDVTLTIFCDFQNGARAYYTDLG